MADPHLQAQLDAAARQKGFQNYGQWAAWNARQQEMRGYNGVGGAPHPQAAPVAHPAAPPPQKNWLQQILDAL